MDEAARPPALERLDAFVGTWTLEGSLPGAPGVVARGRATFEWLAGGRFLISRWEVERPEFPDGIAIVGLDRDGEAFTQHYFDSRGVARVYAMTLRDGVWTLLRDSPDLSPLDFWQRFTGELSADDHTISGRWETSRDGSTWEHDFDLTYRKLT
jgi:hypothetical protein